MTYGNIKRTRKLQCILVCFETRKLQCILVCFEMKTATLLILNIGSLYMFKLKYVVNKLILQL